MHNHLSICGGKSFIERFREGPLTHNTTLKVILISVGIIMALGALAAYVLLGAPAATTAVVGGVGSGLFLTEEILQLLKKDDPEKVRGEIVNVKDDGNCLFRAFAVGMRALNPKFMPHMSQVNPEDLHAPLREAAVDWLRDNLQESQVRENMLGAVNQFAGHMSSRSSQSAEEASEDSVVLHAEKADRFAAIRDRLEEMIGVETLTAEQQDNFNIWAQEYLMNMREPAISGSPDNYEKWAGFAEAMALAEAFKVEVKIYLDVPPPAMPRTHSGQTWGSQYRDNGTICIIQNMVRDHFMAYFPLEAERVSETET